jgi:hypothetical protein
MRGGEIANLMQTKHGISRFFGLKKNVCVWLDYPQTNVTENLGEIFFPRLQSFYYELQYPASGFSAEICLQLRSKQGLFFARGRALSI